VDAITSVIINKALDGLSLRYAATADNIANANSKTYAPKRVAFEDSLKAAAAKGDDAVEQMALDVTRAPASGIGTEPRLDLELANASATSARYSALIELLGREMALDRSVIGAQ